MRLAVLLCATLLSTTLVACGDADDPPDAGAGGSGEDAGAGGSGGTWPDVDVEVHWGECPWGPGECTVFDVPLDWEAPEGEAKLPFFVRRIPTRVSPARGQLWLLQGGPGSAGWSMVPIADEFARIAPGYDILIPDYRGNGYSAWLGCEGEEDEASLTCLRALQSEWGADNLRHFSTTAAAHDIRWAVEAIRRPGDRVLFYGVSYGTFVLNRLLTLHPELADAAILDSVCPAQGCDVRMDVNAVRVAQHAFSLCGADPFCSSKLGADPWSRAMALFDDLAAGHCSEFLGYPSNAAVLRELMVFGILDPQTLPLALASIYRAERCDPADVLALERLIDQLAGASAFSGYELEGAESSDALNLHIVFSEFWPEGLTKAQVEAELAELPFEIGTLRHWAGRRQIWPWPIVPTPAEEKRWSATTASLLLLNGDLDAQTHVDGLAGVEETFVAPDRQQLVIVPQAGHGVLFSSQQLPDDPSLTCGLKLARDFFADPGVPVDTSCTAEVRPIAFAGTRSMARFLLGTDDLWENGSSGTGLALEAPLEPAEARAVEKLRRNLAKRPTF